MPPFYSLWETLHDLVVKNSFATDGHGENVAAFTSRCQKTLIINNLITLMQKDAIISRKRVLNSFPTIISFIHPLNQLVLFSVSNPA